VVIFTASCFCAGWRRALGVLVISGFCRRGRRGTAAERAADSERTFPLEKRACVCGVRPGRVVAPTIGAVAGRMDYRHFSWDDFLHHVPVGILSLLLTSFCQRPAVHERRDVKAGSGSTTSGLG